MTALDYCKSIENEIRSLEFKPTVENINHLCNALRLLVELANTDKKEPEEDVRGDASPADN